MSLGNGGLIDTETNIINDFDVDWDFSLQSGVFYFECMEGYANGPATHRPNTD